MASSSLWTLAMGRSWGRPISGPSVSAGPMTYEVKGKQYLSIQAGAALFTFAVR